MESILFKFFFLHTKRMLAANIWQFLINLMNFNTIRNLKNNSKCSHSVIFSDSEFYLEQRPPPPPLALYSCDFGKTNKQTSRDYYFIYIKIYRLEVPWFPTFPEVEWFRKDVSTIVLMLINSFSTCIYHARSKGAVPPFFSEGGGHWWGTISET